MKSVWQRYEPPDEVVVLLRAFKEMVNDAIRAGIASGVTSLKRLSSLTYRELKRYDIPSCYRLGAMSRAAGVLSSWRKSVKRGRETKEPFAVSLSLTCCYRFRILDGKLLVPLPGGKCLAIALNRHVSEVISTSGVTVRSFTITMDRLALCIAKEVDFKDCHGAAGVDRNLRNITYGNANRTIRFDLSKTVRIAQITKEVVSSFKRNDVRILKKIARKYGRRRRDRTASILHRTSKMIVEEALEAKEAIVLEGIRGIRALYVKGNGQGKGYRGMMNSWPYGEAERQIEYKAAWEGVTTVNLTKGETRGTSTDCPRCGERLQLAAREDTRHRRKLWCIRCNLWTDRDVVAVMNQSRRGWVRFSQSLPDDMRAKGGGDEAMRGNPTMPAILRVDPSKPGVRERPKLWQNP